MTCPWRLHGGLEAPWCGHGVSMAYPWRQHGGPKHNGMATVSPWRAYDILILGLMQYGVSSPCCVLNAMVCRCRAHGGTDALFIGSLWCLDDGPIVPPSWVQCAVVCLWLPLGAYMVGPKRYGPCMAYLFRAHG